LSIPIPPSGKCKYKMEKSCRNGEDVSSSIWVGRDILGPIALPAPKSPLLRPLTMR
jgi:hypothetical protein